MIKVVYRYNADIWKNPYTVKKKISVMTIV